MKVHLTLLVLLLSLMPAGAVLAQGEAPDIKALVKAGAESHQHLMDGNVTVKAKVKIILHQSNKTLSGQLTTNSKVTRYRLYPSDPTKPAFFDLSAASSLSYVTMPENLAGTYRNYELPVPGMNYIMNRMDILVIVDEATFDHCTFDEMIDGIAYYSRALNPEERQVIQQSADQIKRVIAQIKNKTSVAQLESNLNRLNTLIEKGTRFGVDIETGYLVYESSMQYTKEYSDVQYLLGAEFIIPPEMQGLPDHSKREVNQDFILANVDTSPGPVNKPNYETMLLNTKTGQRYRVPTHADTVTWGLLHPDKTRVYATGTQLGEGAYLHEVNVKTGEVLHINEDELKYKILIPQTFSADGKKLLLLATPFHMMAKLQFDHAELDLESYEVKLIPSPPDSTHFNFHPEGKGYIYRQIDKKNNERWIYHYISEDKQTRLIKGDNPIVLHEQKRILFERAYTWYTCDLQGQDVQPFHGGLKGSLSAKLSHDQRFFYFVKRESKEGKPLINIHKLDLKTMKTQTIPNQTWYQTPASP